jgi:hypothetical protein
MKTRHVLKRAAQRGVKEKDLELIVRYGSETAKGVIMTRRDFAQVEQETKQLLGRLSHLVGKFVATQGAEIITVFHATEKQRRSQMTK